MAKSAAPGVILYDGYGKQITPFSKVAMGLFPSQYAYPNYGQFRPRFYTLQDTEKALDVTSRQNLVRLSRELFAQMPALSVASEQKAEWAVGDCFDVVYKGKNKAWGNIATEYLNQWYNTCNVKGYAWDFKTTLKIVSQLLDADGDVLMLFVQSRNGLPLLQFVANHRVGNRNASQNEVTDGKYKGYPIQDGVVYSASGFPVGYCVVGEKAEDDYIVSSKDAQLIFNPRFMDKGRGLPVLASAVLTGLSIQEIDSYIQQVIKLESCVGLVETNEPGEAPAEYANILEAIRSGPTAAATLTPSPNTHGVQVIDGPSIRYVKASGGKLESLTSNRPAQETQQFIRRLETQLLSAVGWPHQLMYSPETLGGRAASSVSEIVRKSIAARQITLEKYAKVAVAYAVAKAMDNGLIPENYDEPLKDVFTFTKPAQFTLDAGYERQSDLNDYRMGIKTLADITSKYGQRYSDVLAQRDSETRELFERAKQIAKDYPEFGFNRALDFLSQRSANALPDAVVTPEVDSTPAEPNKE